MSCCITEPESLVGSQESLPVQMVSGNGLGGAGVQAFHSLWGASQVRGARIGGIPRSLAKSHRCITAVSLS